MKSWCQDGTARVSITSVRLAFVAGALKYHHGILCGIVINLNPRLGMEI